MLLQDLDFHHLKKINKINDFLKENFGFSLDIDTDREKLAQIRKEVSDTVVRLKIQENMSPKDPELTKNLLILEGVELLISRHNILSENKAYSISRRYLNIIDGLAEFVTSAVEVGDDLDDAIAQAMKEYKSSKWRFPDYEIEFDLRKKVADSIQQMESMYEMGLAESEELEEEPVEEEEEIEEAGFSLEPKEPTRGSSRGGSLRGRRASFGGDVDKGRLDKTGRDVADPSAKKKADAYLKKHGSIDWDNVGLADDAWGSAGMDKTGRYVADPARKKKADAFLKKGPKTKGDIDWDSVTVQGQGQAPKAKPKAKPGRGQKAVFDLPEKKGR